MDDRTEGTSGDAGAEKPGTDDRTFLSLGIVFLVLGVGLWVGPGAAGIPFVVMGVTFLLVGVGKLTR